MAEVIGVDVGSPDGDATAYAVKRDGCVSVLTLNPAMGAITAFREVDGAVIAETESGIPLIAPLWPPSFFKRTQSVSGSPTTPEGKT
jgi:hypothetical protein